MSEWKEYKLGELIQSVSETYKFAPNEKVVFLNTSDILEGNFLTYQLSDASTLPGQAKKKIRKGDILFSEIRPANKRYALVNFDCDNYVVSTKLMVLRCSDKDKIDAKFIYIYLTSKEVLEYLQMVAEDRSGTFPQITFDIIANMEIGLPPLEEQRRIAGVLSSLDDKIDLLNRENATLEALAETLFRHYFIENPNPDWKEGKLGDYVTETVGGEWGKETPEEESNMPVCCLRGADVADLNNGLANRTPLRYIKRSKYEKIEPHNGDIILEISGGTDTCSTGRVAYVNDEVKRLFDYPIVFSNFCRLLRVEERHSFFVYCFFRYLHKQGEFFNLENGSSGIHNLNYKSVLYEMDWSVPTDEKSVIDFNERVKPYFDKINANKKQILSLSSQRDTLLPRLMSGELKVGE